MSKLDINKKRIIVIICIIMVLIITLFSIMIYFQSLAKNEKYVIVVGKTDDFESVEFWASVNSGLTMASEEFRVKYEYVSPGNESEVDHQIAIIDEVIQKKPDAIILIASDYNALKESAEKIVDNDIVLFAMDSDVNIIDGKVSFIGTDSYSAGQLAGNWLNRNLNEGERVIILNQYAGASTQINREAGAKSTLQQGVFHSAMNCYDNTYIANSNTKKFLDKKSEFYDPNIKAVYCVNEVVTYGACLAISELNLKDEIKLIGFDTSARLAPYIENGVLDVTIGQKPFNMGYITMQTVVKYLNGQAVQSSIDIGVVMINKDNMFTRENQKLLFPFLN